MSSKIKANLITGFLGSGKTTLLRHFLSSDTLPEKVAVLVNEFGEVAVDGALLKRLSGGVVELANGCICCQLSSDLISSVRDIASRFKPQRLLIESTGIAEPGKVLAALYGPLSETVRVEPTVAVVDASAFDRLYAEVAYHYVMQIKSADLILLNKKDLLTPARLAAVGRKVGELNTRAFVLGTERCRVDLLALFEGKPASPPPDSGNVLRAIEGEEGRVSAGRHEARFVSRTFQDLGRLDPLKLERFLSRLPRAVFRVKGFVETAGGPRLLNWVCGQTDWEPWENGPSTLVFIGSKIAAGSIRRALQRCQT